MEALKFRLEDEIVAAMQRASAAPMQWGVDDCALWCAEPLRRVLGYDPAAQFRTGYCDREGAAVAVGALGLGFAIKGIARKHGWKAIDPSEAQIGDIGLKALPDADGVIRTSTMICRCPGWFVGRSRLGYIALGAGAVRVAWAVLR